MARRAASAGQAELMLAGPATPAPHPGAPAVLTIGHSARTAAEFLALLKAHDVALLLDVRAAPYSRRHPQFNRESLAAALAAAGLAYRHLPALGGMRRPRPDSANTGWREDAYRGYADHMASAEFAAARDAVLALARIQRPALMCAEADPQNCHRRLIADALVARGAAVRHIVDAGSPRPHELTPFARASHGDVTYPPHLHR